MPKLLSLDKILAKKYKVVEGLTPEFIASFGDIEDCFDMLVYGDSGNGKTNLVLELMAQLCTALGCGATYISWEEGHGKSLRDALVRQNLMERLGNVMEVSDGGSYDDVRKLLTKRKSKKVILFDSVQASEFTVNEWAALKKEFVMGKRRKIFIYISWVDGKRPKGIAAESLRYYANIKVFVDRFMAFPASRYGGGKTFVIWEDGAMKRYGKKLYNKLKKQ
jgi:KaiC/GvpD/RAD55 family RecA-like ATPase